MTEEAEAGAPNDAFPASLTGEAFSAAEVVAQYVHRPPYPAQVYDHIIRNAPSTHRLLDLGCGEGKLARPFSKTFEDVVAVDPSDEMIALGKSLENGQAANIQWIAAKAEDTPLNGQFDVVTFASSIHWMDPETLFTRLRRHLPNDHMLAIVSGDTAHAPPWAEEWQQFLNKWVPIATGRPFGSSEWRATRDKHLDSITVIQSNTFTSAPFQQTVRGHILCQHSRDTFAVPRLGSRLSEFQDELQDLLDPFANDAGNLIFQVQSEVTLARLTDPNNQE